MKKILIVDDSPFFRSLLKDALRRDYFDSANEVDILEAKDVISAMDQIRTENPNLVLLDIVMEESEYEGIKLLRNIREFYPDLKVVMLTSVGQESVIKECFEIGVQDFLEKPFDSAKLIQVVRENLG